jgi:hypothetical protein
MSLAEICAVARPVRGTPLAATIHRPTHNRQSVGPTSKPRRERTQEYDVTSTCWVLVTLLCFHSITAGLMKSAGLRKVQTIGRDRRGLLIGPYTVIARLGRCPNDSSRLKIPNRPVAKSELAENFAAMLS